MGQIGSQDLLEKQMFRHGKTAILKSSTHLLPHPKLEFAFEGSLLCLEKTTLLGLFGYARVKLR